MNNLFHVDMCTEGGSVYPGEPQNLAPNPNWPARTSELKLCMGSVGVLYALLAGYALTDGWFAAAFAHGAVVWQLGWPIRRADRLGVSLDRLGLHARGAWGELTWALAALVTVLPPWALAALAVAPTWGPLGLVPGPQGPLAWLALAATQVLGVALPEECFWRGYVQPVLQHAHGARPRGSWPSGRWAPTGILTGALLFGLGHAIGGQGVLGLATALPALMFGTLRARRGSLVGAVVAHTGCNLAAVALAQTFGAA